MLAQAIALIDDDALPYRARWSWGGGTRLAQLYGHRISYDIDLFVTDVQVLPALSPRLNEQAARIVTDYVESSESLKLATAAGDIDIIAAPVLTTPGVVSFEFEGRTIAAQTAEEILAKKLQYRGHSLAARDAFDLAALLELNPAAVAAAVAACSERARNQTAARLGVMLPSLAEGLHKGVNPTPQFARLMDAAPAILSGWLPMLGAR